MALRTTIHSDPITICEGEWDALMHKKHHPNDRVLVPGTTGIDISWKDIIPRVSTIIGKRCPSMLNFLRHASDRGRKELVLKMDDFEYNILILLALVGGIIIKSRTKTDITILVEKP